MQLHGAHRQWADAGTVAHLYTVVAKCPALMRLRSIVKDEFIWQEVS